MKSKFDNDSVKKQLKIKSSKHTFYSIQNLSALGIKSTDKLPLSIKVLLESAVRNFDDYQVTINDINNIAGWSARSNAPKEIAFKDRKSVV